jgi:cyclophilin family peptidyl-prolyl cis-trans isomerase
MSPPRTFFIPRIGGRLAMACLLLVIAAAGGCGKSSPETAKSNADQAAPPAGKAAPPKSTDLKHPVVKVETNLGAIKIRLDAEKAPGTVRNFLNYVNKGFYKDTIFHFVDPGKMIVGGGFSSNQELKDARDTIRNEAHNGRKNVRGTVAMVRNSQLIDSASSQFFINLEDAPQRDHTGSTAEEYGYCVFGDVIEGLDVAERISQTPTVNLSQRHEVLSQTPKTPVVISSIQIVM